MALKVVTAASPDFEVEGRLEPSPLHEEESTLPSVVLVSRGTGSAAVLTFGRAAIDAGETTLHLFNRVRAGCRMAGGGDFRVWGDVSDAFDVSVEQCMAVAQYLPAT